jgi:hypothetical protein
MTARDEILSLISDLHKDARGFRPSSSYFANLGSLTDAGLDDVFNGLCFELEESQARERAAEAEAAKRFETSIATLIASGAGDRATAIRWLAQAHGAEEDSGYLEYQLGLPYHYLEKAA